MKKRYLLFGLIALLLLGLSACSGDVLDDDGTKHITFVNNMDCIVTSIEATAGDEESKNLLSANTQLSPSDRTMLKIPVESADALKNTEMIITDSKGVVYKFKELDLKNAGSLTFELDADGDPSLIIGS